MMITSTERNLIVIIRKMCRIDLLPPAVIGSGRTTRHSMSNLKQEIPDHVL